MSAHNPMLDLLRARRKRYSLPGPFYSDPDFFALDLDAIFHRRWIFAGATCEIPQPGDYFTLALGRTSIIVLRDRAGDIRAFFNTCRHRGSRICVAKKGRAAALVCPYHHWTYDLSGALRHASSMQASFDPSGIALGAVHVETVAGTIYVCAADEPPDFAPLRAALEPCLAPHDLANAKLAHEADLIERGNWKLVMENSRECHHCRAGHPELVRTLMDVYDFGEPLEDPRIAAFMARSAAAGLPGDPRVGDDFRVIRLPLTRDAVSITMDGRPAVARRLGRVPDGGIGSLRWVHYPSTFNHALGDYVFLVRMLPIGPEETLVTAKWLVHRDAEEGRDYSIDRLTEVWAKTNDQDRVLVERNQLGVNSLGYQPGPYSEPAEPGVIKFVEWYCDTMERYLGGA